LANERQPLLRECHLIFALHSSWHEKKHRVTYLKDPLAVALVIVAGGKYNDAEWSSISGDGPAPALASYIR